MFTCMFNYDGIHGQWEHNELKLKDEKTLFFVSIESLSAFNYVRLFLVDFSLIWKDNKEATTPNLSKSAIRAPYRLSTSAIKSANRVRFLIHVSQAWVGLGSSKLNP
ncbi:hypothetical protein YC2023_080165 [Brassica napus]